MNGFTPAEQMVVCISREIRDGDAVGLGIGTALTAAGVLLAQRTHAPHLQIFVPAAGAYCRSLEGVALSLAEAVAARAALRLADLEEVLTEGLDTRHKQFFRPAQIDPYGNFNNTVIGSYGNPRIRLPGAAGIPEVTAFYEELYFYVPRHSPHCFVEKLDFLSGIGHLRGERGAARRALGVLGRGPVRVVSDLGVFGFGEDGRMEVVSLHAGVSWEEVQSRTGFALRRPAVVPTTEPPTAEELRLLREVIDPLGIRDLELLGSRERADLIRRIFAAEPDRFAGS